MHGLINKSIEGFVKETYGLARWAEVADHAALGFADFEAMLPYDAEITDRTLDAIAEVLARRRDDVLEDLGTFLVTSPSVPAIRRLLRFGGCGYEDFLHSLEELPDRLRLAMSELSLPDLTLVEEGEGQFRLICHPGLDGYCQVVVGVLRAMADDYGALAMLALDGQTEKGDTITISIVQDAYAEGKTFQLGARAT